MSSTPDKVEDEDGDVLLEDLLAACERAFRNGVNSAQIYETLIEMKANAESERIVPQELSWYKQCTQFQSVRKFFWVFVFTVGAVFWVYWMISHLLGVSLWPLSEFYDSRCLLPSHPLVMELTRPITNCSICKHHLTNGTPVIEFSSSPTSEEFEKVAYSSKPIIVRGGAVATGMSTTFTFTTLKSLFESEPGAIESVINDCQFLPFRSSFTKLEEVFATVINDSQSFETPWYIGWSNCHPGIVETLRKLFPRPDFLPKDSESSAIDWIFLGSAGYGAAMHLDYVRRPSWQAQLSGRKRWSLKPPPECESVCTGDVVFSIDAGDMLFLDTNSWYHETFIEGTEFSISIGSEYD